MAQSRELLWVEKCYFTGWTCSSCLWRSDGFRWNRGSETYPGIRVEFETHDCAAHQEPAASLSRLVLEY